MRMLGIEPESTRRAAICLPQLLRLKGCISQAWKSNRNNPFWGSFLVFYIGTSFPWLYQKLSIQAWVLLGYYTNVSCYFTVWDIQGHTDIQHYSIPLIDHHLYIRHTHSGSITDALSLDLGICVLKSPWLSEPGEVFHDPETVCSASLGEHPFGGRVW